MQYVRAQLVIGAITTVAGICCGKMAVPRVLTKDRDRHARHAAEKRASGTKNSLSNLAALDQREYTSTSVEDSTPRPSVNGHNHGMNSAMITKAKKPPIITSTANVRQLSLLGSRVRQSAIRIVTKAQESPNNNVSSCLIFSFEGSRSGAHASTCATDRSKKYTTHMTTSW